HNWEEKKAIFYKRGILNRTPLLCLGLHTCEDKFTFTRNINFATSSINKGHITFIQTQAFILTAE
ncbi:MAG: hypothetical protein PUC07_06155, partial [Solobacterium sp.]|nr:hypothetical protein [Solobacterium sp.]